jgi:hypothetical protein
LQKAVDGKNVDKIKYFGVNRRRIGILAGKQKQGGTRVTSRDIRKGLRWYYMGG